MLYIGDEKARWKTAGLYSDFMLYELVFLTDPALISSLADQIALVDSSKSGRIMIYLDSSLNQEEVLANILNSTAYDKYRRILPSVYVFEW